MGRFQLCLKKFWVTDRLCPPTPPRIQARADPMLLIKGLLTLFSVSVVLALSEPPSFTRGSRVGRGEGFFLYEFIETNTLYLHCWSIFWNQLLTHFSTNNSSILFVVVVRRSRAGGASLLFGVLTPINCVTQTASAVSTCVGDLLTAAYILLTYTVLVILYVTHSMSFVAFVVYAR